MNFQPLRHGMGLSALALSVALLQACGGGAGSASSSAGPTLNGTVTGFGSVIVDGREVEDAYARIAHENADGTLTNDVLQMGQRVRVAQDGAGKASQVLIDAAVIGRVSKKTASDLTVAGQLVTINTDSAAGPVTVFGGGYTDLSSVVETDLVQVHGTPVYDTASKSYTVRATRIQKDSGTERVQVSGKIDNYNSTSSGATFVLNGLTVSTSSSTAVRPSGATLANGVQVTAFGGALSGTTLTATNVRVDRNQSSANTTMQAQLSGAVSAYDASAGTFELQGTTVKLGSATVQPAGASVANNAYVMVDGTVGSDGSITATSIQVRTSDTTSELAKVLLIGPISDYVDNSSFVVRGVPVDASTIDFAKACPGVTVANDLPVRVQASQQAGTAVVKASQVSCQAQPGTQLIKPLDGTVASVDSTAKTFILGNTTVQWTETTTFLGLTAAELNGKSVHVDGYTSGNLFVARVVRLDDGSSTAPVMDDKRFRRPAAGAALPPPGWQQYRNAPH